MSPGILLSTPYFLPSQLGLQIHVVKLACQVHSGRWNLGSYACTGKHSPAETSPAPEAGSHDVMSVLSIELLSVPSRPVHLLHFSVLGPCDAVYGEQMDLRVSGLDWGLVS